MSKQLNFEDAEDHEIFDINDFTTASDWERFIVQIEETINQWKLNSMNPTTQNDELNKNVINYFSVNDISFYINYTFRSILRMANGSKNQKQSNLQTRLHSP